MFGSIPAVSRGVAAPLLPGSFAAASLPRAVDPLWPPLDAVVGMIRRSKGMQRRMDPAMMKLIELILFLCLAWHYIGCFWVRSPPPPLAHAAVRSHAHSEPSDEAPIHVHKPCTQSLPWGIISEKPSPCAQPSRARCALAVVRG